jgi:hypothetical protein
MKKLLRYAVVILFITGLSFCGQKPADKLVGSWKVSGVELGNWDQFAEKTKDMVKAEFNKQKTEQSEQFKNNKAALEMFNKMMDKGLDSTLQAFDKIIVTQKDSVMKDFEKWVFTFNSDMSYEIKKGIEITEKGTWSVSDDGKKLTTKSDSGEEVSDLELGDNKFTVNFEKGMDKKDTKDMSKELADFKFKARFVFEPEKK